jgi:hypothetical protein
MWAIEVMHKATGEVDLIMGYNFEDACRRKGWNPKDYYVIHATYED